MNDITALMQRLKVYAEEFSYPVLSPDDCRALVEALEKAQQYAKERDEENQGLMLTVGRLRTEREALESRTVTVKLPDEVDVLLNHLEDVLPSEAFQLIDVHKWNAVSRLSAIGIQVIEGEG
ncbi:TPA: hypothetical protein ACGEYS_002962 [Kluyvera cryocrescens]